MSDLKNHSCVPCEVGAPTLTSDEIKEHMKKVDSWNLAEDERKIFRDFQLKDFQESIRFINKIGEIAEKEGHHPDIRLHDYKNVEITLWTHKIGGLHRNDFILASKIDSLI